MSLDRTSELRKKGYVGRRLGPKQMTTDTAVRVTRLVVQQKMPLEQIPYVDYPELHINEHERTEMPFRYVKDAQGQPIMPDVSTLVLLVCTRTGYSLIVLGHDGSDQKGRRQGRRGFVLNPQIKSSDEDMYDRDSRTVLPTACSGRQ
jgi:hypothetical protein